MTFVRLLFGLCEGIFLLSCLCLLYTSATDGSLATAAVLGLLFSVPMILLEFIYQGLFKMPGELRVSLLFLAASIVGLFLAVMAFLIIDAGGFYQGGLPFL